MTTGIQVSVIAPVQYLHDFVEQIPPTIHYIAAQRVLQDACYRRFYLEQAERGASLIVDNGVFDLGHSLCADDLVRAAREVNAYEIVLPDVVHDGRRTVLASERGARAVHRLTDRFRLCAVVQGSSDSDWLRCYDQFVSADYVQAIAIPSPTHRPPLGGLVFDRLQATQHLDTNRLVAPHLVYRLLGLGDSGHIELSHQRQFQWIRTVDSSAPVVLGALGRRITPGQPYTKASTRVEDLPPIQESCYPIIRQNIATLRAAAGCSLRLLESAQHVAPSGGRSSETHV
jgi:hypothetical protein